MDGRLENCLFIDDLNVLENWLLKIYDDYLGFNYV